MAKKITSNEMRIAGTNEDAALHDEILDDPESEREANKLAVKRAIDDGMDPKLAKELYGV